MTDFAKVEQNLTALGYTVKTFATGAEAAAYLNGTIDGTTVGIGGSMSVQQLGLYDLLASHNEVHWHWVNGPAEREQAVGTQVYLTSVNGLAETGELINIDGIGNRIAATLYGHKKVWFVAGRNKLAPTYDEALWHGISPRPRTPSGCRKRPPAPSRETAATTARVRTGSAGAWWSFGAP